MKSPSIPSAHEATPAGPPSSDAPVRPDVPVSPGGVVAGKYRIDAVNGFGGMGIVCEAFHLDLQTKVEVQIARREHLKDERAVPRILSAARSAAQLRSQHARRVLDCGRLDVGAPYMVVEHIEGADLRRIGTALGRLSVEEAMSFVLQACEALGEAHSRGIVHGDLKPENLYLTRGPDGGALIKVLDLGVSKQLGHSPYMSPEQKINPTAADARADIWSLGVLIHELLTGKVPRSPSDVNVGIPDSLATIVLRCMDKKRDARFPEATALGRALRAFGGTASLSAERVEEILRCARLPRPEGETSQSVVAVPESVAGVPESVAGVPESDADMPASVVDTPESVTEQRDSVVDMPDSVVDVPDSVPPPVHSVPAASQSVPAKRPSQATKPPPLPPSHSPPAPMPRQLVGRLNPLIEKLSPLAEKRSAQLTVAGVLLGSLFAILASPRGHPTPEPSSASTPSMRARAIEPAPPVVESALPVVEPAPSVAEADQPKLPSSAAPVASSAPPPRAPATAPGPASEPARTATPKENPGSTTKPASAPASSPRKRAWSPFPELKQPVLPPHVQ